MSNKKQSSSLKSKLLFVIILILIALAIKLLRADYYHSKFSFSDKKTSQNQLTNHSVNKLVKQTRENVEKSLDNLKEKTNIFLIETESHLTNKLQTEILSVNDHSTASSNLISGLGGLQQNSKQALYNLSNLTQNLSEKILGAKTEREQGSTTQLTTDDNSNDDTIVTTPTPTLLPKPISLGQRAWDYTRYQYCKQVVREYEAVYGK